MFIAGQSSVGPQPAWLQHQSTEDLLGLPTDRQIHRELPHPGHLLVPLSKGRSEACLGFSFSIVTDDTQLKVQGFLCNCRGPWTGQHYDKWELKSLYMYYRTLWKRCSIKWNQNADVTNCMFNIRKHYLVQILKYTVKLSVHVFMVAYFLWISLILLANKF